MFDFSVFRHDYKKSAFPHEVPQSKDYKVFVNRAEIPVYTCRISAYPFNTWWPGYQRPVAQSEIVSFVNLVSDEEIEIAVESLTKTDYNRVMIKPYARNVQYEKRGEQIVFTLKENGGYILELDDYHGMLYIFNNKPCPCEAPETVTHYFGKGVHFPGKIVLHSNESVYLEKDALVYGCIFAENAENIHIYGNGIFDDSGEERFCEESCYETYTNGNIKFYDCKNIKIEGVGFTNSAIWCVNLFHCFDVDIDGINVFGQWRYNTDGIDIVNSQRVTIKNSFVHSFDDSITVKGIDKYAFASNEDILIENCVLWCDWGRTCEIGLETMCSEYKNITFRNCDLLRAGSVACDIQNGDCAEVHNILFENIRVELEGFYTASVYQSSDEQKYDAQDTHEVAAIISIANQRFREMDIYAHLEFAEMQDFKKPAKNKFASVCDVQFKDIFVYADEEVINYTGGKCATIHVVNCLEDSEYKNITVENIVVNGQRLEETQMAINVQGMERKELIVK